MLSRYTFFFLAGLLGLIDSVYLLREHIYAGGATCTFETGFGALFACDVVTTSSYAVVFGIPVALIGIVFYTAILLCVFLYRYFGSSAGRYGWWLLAGAGVLGTLWFLYVQAFILNAYCLYCLFSALFVGVLALGALFDYRSFKKPRAKSVSASFAKETSFDDTPPLS